MRPTEKKLLGLICRVAQVGCKELKVGIGDDCAVVRHTAGEDLLFSTDLLLEGMHFRLDWTTPFLLGYKALAVNVSDIAAMGGRPLLYLVSLGLPARQARSTFVERLYLGMELAAREYRVALGGGDLSGSNSGVVISIAIAGLAAADKAFLRRGAQPGDHLFVCGHLGLSAIGLELLRAGYRVPLGMKKESMLNKRAGTSISLVQWRKRCVLAHLAPTPPVDVAKDLSAHNLASAMMDISDGLSIDLHRLCEASGVGAVVYSAQLPGCPHTILDHEKQRDCMLHGGEDYALLFTVPKQKAGHLELLMKRHMDIPIARIGRITRKEGVFIQEDSVRAPLPPLGYDHFRSRHAGARIRTGSGGRDLERRRRVVRQPDPRASQNRDEKKKP